METAGLLIGGLVLLLLGGEWLVRGASRLALSLGVSRVIIGLSLVAFGTSAPEMAVSVLSSYRGQSGIAVGNVVGSNIVNVLLILGLSAVVAPLAVSKRIIRIEVPFMIACSLLFLALGYDGLLSRLDGFILVAIFLSYMAWMMHTAKKESDIEKDLPVGDTAAPPSALGYLYLAGLVVAGLAGLVLGSNWLVEGAVALARTMGVSEVIIGLTIVAVGTSLPEMATSVIASIRGEREISVGNVIGSNIFNILSILGFSTVVAPAGLEVPSAVVRFDALVMIAVSLACLPIFFNDFEIKRWEGGLFVAYYIFYVGYLILYASQHDALNEYTLAMRWFVLPFVALTLTLVLFLAWRKHVWLPRRAVDDQT
ncbi:MAG: calcium/sodium antiporter [Chthonomonadetes bacterium]|nr:calcium/sodium antiporter [Chthonomonadetes bacterium]